MWSQNRITWFVGYCKKVQIKFDLDCLLYRYYVSSNKESTILITDVDFPSINLNDILTIIVHLKDRQSNESSIGPFNIAISFLKDYISKYCRADVEFAHLFRTENLLARNSTELPEAQILTKGPIKEPEFGFVYLKKKINQKEFSRVLDKQLVPTKILQKIITNVAKSESSEHIKKKATPMVHRVPKMAPQCLSVRLQ